MFRRNSEVVGSSCSFLPLHEALAALTFLVGVGAKIVEDEVVGTALLASTGADGPSSAIVEGFCLYSFF